MYSIQIVVEPYFHYQKKSRNKVNYCYVFSIRLTLKLQVSFFQTASISCNSYPLNIHTSPIYLSINQTSNFDIANLFPRFVSSILPQLVNWQVFRSRLVQPAIVFLVMRQSLFVCKVRSIRFPRRVCFQKDYLRTLLMLIPMNASKLRRSQATRYALTVRSDLILNQLNSTACK